MPLRVVGSLTVYRFALYPGGHGKIQNGTVIAPPPGIELEMLEEVQGHGESAGNGVERHNHQTHGLG